MPVPKITAELEIPADLVAFLRKVYEMIGLGWVNDESDDGIQFPEFTTCGGLWDKKRGIYGFVHYLERPPGDRRWEIQLDIETIASIVNGERTTLSGWQCSHKDCDNFYTQDDGYCRLCDAPEGREARIKSDSDFARRVEAFNESHGAEFEKLRQEHVNAVQAVLEDPKLQGDIRKKLEVARKLDEEYDERIRKLFESAGMGYGAENGEGGKASPATSLTFARE